MNDKYVEEKRNFEADLLAGRYCGVTNPEYSFKNLEAVLTQEFDAEKDTIEKVGSYVLEAMVYYFGKTISIETVTLGYFKNDGDYEVYYIPSARLSSYHYVAGSKHHALILKMEGDRVVDYFHFGNCPFNASLDLLIRRFLKP